MANGGVTLSATRRRSGLVSRGDTEDQWITEFLEGTKHPKEIKEMTTGLVSVPLIIEHPSGVNDTGTLVAGMLGFTIHADNTKEVSVRPFQGWSLLLSKDSPFL